MLRTLEITNLFPGNEHHIQAILRANNAVEVYRINGDIVYRVVK